MWFFTGDNPLIQSPSPGLPVYTPFSQEIATSESGELFAYITGQEHKNYVHILDNSIDLSILP